MADLNDLISIEAGTELIDTSVPEHQMPTIEEIDDDDLCHLSVMRLAPKFQRFCHLYLSGSHTITEIAMILNVAPVTVRGWLMKPKIKQAIEEFQDQEDMIIKQGLKALRIKALNKMGELVDSNIDGIAWQAAKDILDRTGYKPKVVSESHHTVTFEEQMKEVLHELKVDYIDVTP